MINIKNYKILIINYDFYLCKTNPLYIENNIQLLKLNNKIINYL